MEYTKAEIFEMRDSGMTQRQIAEATGMTIDQIRWRLQSRPGGQSAPRLPASPYPVLDQPLTCEGDALILNDLEVPFHHAEFVNRCLDLCEAWDIHQLILGGDVMHFETFSAWGAAWQQEQPEIDSISEKTESEFRAAIQALPAEMQPALMDKLNQLIESRTSADDEIKAGAKALKTLAQVFRNIYYILGNHDDRFLRKLNSPLTPGRLLNFLGLTDPCWHIAPYFYGLLTSEGEKYRIEHPRPASENTGIRQADIHSAHVIIGHSHLQSLRWSSSGKYYAILSGCAVDERRLAYAAQRDTNRPAHKLGAVVVRDGYPHLLHDRIPWAEYMKMK